MSLKHLILTGACVIASSNAAVNFYGSERPYGDHVTCEVPDVSDDCVSAALGMIYFPSEVVPDSNDLQFDETMFCGDLASVAVEFACYDLGGDSTCIPAQPDADAETGTADAETDDADAGSDTTGTDSDTVDADAADADSDTSGSGSDTVSRRSLTHFEKRAGAECDQWTLKCKNEYRSSTGYCSSGYNTRNYQVAGQSVDIWCEKDCTDEETKVCQDQVCPKGKQQCEKFGYSNDCAEALAKCPGSPVNMPERLCTTQYMSGLLHLRCKKKNPACVVYEDGACTLRASDYEAFVKELDEAFSTSFI